MQHDLVRVLLRVMRVALAPIVADCVGEDVAVAVELCRRDGSADLRVPLEPMLGVLVPEVEGAVATGGAKGAVLGMEGDGVDRVNFGDVALGGVVLAVAFEGEV